MHYKSLWIKASAKCVNVNVNSWLAMLLGNTPQDVSHKKVTHGHPTYGALDTMSNPKNLLLESM